jgi:hypothetical protein
MKNDYWAHHSNLINYEHSKYSLFTAYVGACVSTLPFAFGWIMRRAGCFRDLPGAESATTNFQHNKTRNKIRSRDIL